MLKLRPLSGLFLSILTVLVVWLFPSTEAKAQTQAKQKKAVTAGRKIVFLITKDPDNYEAHKTVPVFAQMLTKKYGYNVTVLLGNGGHGSYRYPDMTAVTAADLLVVFARRIALPKEQMEVLKSYVKRGKPVLGIRTANHAFTPREKVEEGFEAWPEFVSDVVGCENRGYGPVDPGTDVEVVPDAARHPIVKNIKPDLWHSKGNVYLVAPLLDKEAVILLEGEVNEITQPVAWTRRFGNSKVFYTSLGYPTDFKTPQFTTLLINAIRWTLGKE